MEAIGDTWAGPCPCFRFLSTGIALEAHEILGAVLGAYQLCLTDVQLLLSWTAGRD